MERAASTYRSKVDAVLAVIGVATVVVGVGAAARAAAARRPAEVLGSLLVLLIIGAIAAVAVPMRYTIGAHELTIRSGSRAGGSRPSRSAA